MMQVNTGKRYIGIMSSHSETDTGRSDDYDALFELIICKKKKKRNCNHMNKYAVASKHTGAQANYVTLQNILRHLAANICSIS